MGILYKQTSAIRVQLATIIGETKVKTFFSYYAIFKNDLMFGLYKEGKFYLRIPKKRISHTFWITESLRLYDPNVGVYHKNFYEVPEKILSDSHYYREILLETLDEITAAKQLSEIKRKRLIRSLPNLNINIERTLRKLGINSIKELQEIGEANIFVEMIKRGIEANQTLLFKLYGAIHRQYIYTLTEQQKRKIMQDADQALYNNGLRKRFNIKD